MAICGVMGVIEGNCVEVYPRWRSTASRISPAGDQRTPRLPPIREPLPDILLLSLCFQMNYNARSRLSVWPRADPVMVVAGILARPGVRSCRHRAKRRLTCSVVGRNEWMNGATYKRAVDYNLISQLQLQLHTRFLYSPPRETLVDCQRIV